MDKDKDSAAGVPPWHGDEHHGEGGSFVFDPKTGKRTRVPAEGGAAPAAQQKTEPAAESARKARKE